MTDKVKHTGRPSKLKKHRSAPKKYQQGDFAPTLFFPSLVTYAVFIAGYSIFLLLKPSASVFELYLFKDKLELILLLAFTSFVLCFVLGYRFRFSTKKLPKVDQTFMQRHKVEIIAILLVSAIFFITAWMDQYFFDVEKIYPSVMYFLTHYSDVISPHLLVIVWVGSYVSYFLGVIVKTKILGFWVVKLQEILLVGVAFIVLFGGSVWMLYTQAQNKLTAEEYQTQRLLTGEAGRMEAGLYWYTSPFSGSNTLTPIQGKNLLQIEQDFPRIDGAESLFPFYTSAIEAIYKTPTSKEEQQTMRGVVQNNGSSKAYERLIAGDVDLIFVYTLSQKQIEAAQEQGLGLKMSAIGKEALVLMVNEKNPVQSLTTEQVRFIYAGDLTHWSEVGGTKQTIRAFQNADGADSQNYMAQELMQSQALKTPLRETLPMGLAYGNCMGPPGVGTADYRNAKNAIGYAFKLNIDRMDVQKEGVRLLAINGIEPTRENIRNGSYPFTSELLMVTARPASENTQKLMDWFLSEQGQQLVQDVGYVPLMEK